MAQPSEDRLRAVAQRPSSLLRVARPRKLEVAEKRGAPAAGQAGARPDGARHPSRPHRGVAEAARVPGPRPSRGPDRRRLHRARRGSQRALHDPPGVERRRDRCQRRDLPPAGLHGAARRSRLLEVRRTASGWTCAPNSSSASRCGDGGPDPRARRLRQALRRPSPISVLETLLPVAEGHDSAGDTADVELGRTDQTFNLLLGRDVQRAYGQPEQTILTMPILPGIDGTEKMSKSLGNHVGVTEDPDEQFGKTMRLPDEAMGPGSRCWRFLARLRARARATPSARWRGGRRPLPWRGGRGGGRAALRSRISNT